MEAYPAPWKWYWRLNDEGLAECGVFWEKFEGHVYSVCRAHRYENFEQWKANARLIAAAPDLLEALKALSSEEYRDDDDPILNKVRLQAKLAIAKAEGENQK